MRWRRRLRPPRPRRPPRRRRRPTANASRVADFFIRRPIVAIVIAILTVLIGINTLRGLSFEQYPLLPPPPIRATATYPGAPAPAVQQPLATPLDHEANGPARMRD